MKLTKPTKSQKEALKEACNFIDNGDSRSWFTLEGKAGVGKTTVLIDLIFKYNTKKNIVACAISHKAKNILYDKSKHRLAKTKYTNTVTFVSVASLLGMKFDETTGEFIYEKKNILTLRPIDKADIIIIDECSMIDEKILELIFKEKKFKTKVIFSGDIGQLPPLRETDSDEPSPTFNTTNKYQLFERLRQGDESPILPFSDYYWNSVIENIDYTFNIPRSSIFNDRGNIHFTSKQDAINEAIPAFKKAIDTHDMNLIKVVCYRNDARNSINQYIRQSIFDNPNEFEKNDFLIMMNNYSFDEYNIVENSQEFQIIDIDERIDVVEGESLKIYELTVDYKINGHNVTLPVVSKESRNDFMRIVGSLFEKAKKMDAYSKDRTNAFSHAYKVKNKYADLDYGYSCTSHKAQGSTYKAVIVYEGDIMSVMMTSLKTKFRSMYTAITRGSDICIIMN
jgi:exodeoxyribonuclease-5